jgi:hypothetical protein
VSTNRRWSNEELNALRAWYGQGNQAPLYAGRLAQQLGRTVEAVTLKASRLRLTSRANLARPRVAQRKIRRAQFASDAERRNAASARSRTWIAKNGHPRGATGLVHTPAARALMGAASRASWANPASSHRSAQSLQWRSDAIHALQVAGKMRRRYTRSAGGMRPDLGFYVRSAWEANYARYLRFLQAHGEIIRWSYEPKTFDFPQIRRGTRAYTPDFYVEFPDGHHEWHEVKGWMDPQSRTRLNRMSKFYPAEPLVIRDKTWFGQMNRGLAGVIPCWERR